MANNVSILNKFIKNSSKYLKGNVYYFDDNLDEEFVNEYIELRKFENRLLSDEMVKKLPIYIGKLENLRSEWKSRQVSSLKIRNYLNKSPETLHILDVGCGNGWLINYLNNSKHLYFGIDINITELKQAARLFASNNSFFIFGNIVKDQIPFQKGSFDVIILSSAIQYFEDLEILLTKLYYILTEKGEIHIIDTNFYHNNEVEQATLRSDKYYDSIKFSRMKNYYFHHTWEKLEKHNVTIVKNSKNILTIFKMKLLRKNYSNFPWIIVKKS